MLPQTELVDQGKASLIEDLNAEVAEPPESELTHVLRLPDRLEQGLMVGIGWIHTASGLLEAVDDQLRRQEGESLHQLGDPVQDSARVGRIRSRPWRAEAGPRLGGSTIQNRRFLEGGHLTIEQGSRLELGIRLDANDGQHLLVDVLSVAHVGGHTDPHRVRIVAEQFSGEGVAGRGVRRARRAGVQAIESAHQLGQPDHFPTRDRRTDVVHADEWIDPADPVWESIVEAKNGE